MQTVCRRWTRWVFDGCKRLRGLTLTRQFDEAIYAPKRSACLTMHSMGISDIPDIDRGVCTQPGSFTKHLSACNAADYSDHRCKLQTCAPVVATVSAMTCGCCSRQAYPYMASLLCCKTRTVPTGAWHSIGAGWLGTDIRRACHHLASASSAAVQSTVVSNRPSMLFGVPWLPRSMLPSDDVADFRFERTIEHAMWFTCHLLQRGRKQSGDLCPIPSCFLKANANVIVRSNIFECGSLHCR